MTGKPLLGRTIAVPETRELDRLVSLLVEQGATPLAYPLVGIRDTDDVEPVAAWLDELAARRMDDVIFFTGEGVRRLAAFAERRGILDRVVSALAAVRTITRGPKPAAAIHELGLRPTRPARVPTTEGIIQELSNEDLGGRRVGVQLYAKDASPELVKFLVAQGAVVTPVMPYVYVDASTDARVIELIGKLVAIDVDAIAFTSGAQVDRVFQVAAASGLSAELASALDRVVVAAVGPACAACLSRHGVVPSVVPERSFFMRTLVEQLTAKLGRARSKVGSSS